MYADGEKVANDLGVDYNDTAVATEVDSLIATASALIDSYCQRKFTDGATATKKFSYTKGKLLDLAPHVLGPSPTVSYIDSNGTATELTEDVDYYLMPENPMITDRNGVPRYIYIELATPNAYVGGRRNIRITGPWGFDAQDVPLTLERACLQTIRHLVSLASMPNERVITDSGLGRTVEYSDRITPDVLPNHVKMILDRTYKHGDLELR